MKAAPLFWRNPRLSGRIPELDGVRGTAILLVLVHHYVGITVPAESGTCLAHFIASLRLTWSGVDLFFVLSGFLIGGILVDAKSSTRYYGSFYGRRMCRILPVYLIWLALFWIGLIIWPQRGDVRGVLFNRGLPPWCYALFLQNVFMTLRCTFGALWLGITWSLAVEEQFYILLPFAVRHLSRKGLVRLGCAAVICAPIVRVCLYFSGNDHFGPYTLLPSRADALALGVLAAVACRDEATWKWLTRHRSRLCLAFFGLGCGLFVLRQGETNTLLMGSIGYTWLALFYTSLLLLAVVNPGRLEMRVFGNAVLMKLGTVAYAVYITHFGINYLLHGLVFGRRPAVSDWASGLVTVLSLAVVLSVSAVSWRFLEHPLIRYARARFRYQTEGGKPESEFRGNLGRLRLPNIGVIPDCNRSSV